MVLADAVATDRAKDLSGVNLLFLAPEYYSHDTPFDWKVDVWSIGVILYLLITNGVDTELTGGKYAEYFNFMEPIWNAVDSHLKNFIEMMVKVVPEDRE